MPFTAELREVELGVTAEELAQHLAELLCRVVLDHQELHGGFSAMTTTLTRSHLGSARPPVYNRPAEEVTRT